ncbi:MAG: serine/threonine-protein kinase, partial [Planctomycetota bacterium]
MAYTFKYGDRPLDDYTIQRAVGGGGFGEVYYSISDGGREVALKYLRDNPQIELRGVSHCMNLKSPHLISVFDVKKNAQGEYFIIMEYCSGPSLRDVLIAEPKGLGPQKAAFFVREIGKGLAYLHDRGIVHRDLKPGNIFYDDGYVKIGDYGLTKFISVSRHSAQTASIGTVHYMAPEIGSGNYSRGVDIYALGVILYEMLLGRVPFEGSTMGEVLMKHLTAQPILDELPNPFGRVIRKALQKDPKDRYQHVNEMVEDLLSVEEIQESLAGFSTQSLNGVVDRAMADRFDSPMPSPNPMFGPAGHAHEGGPRVAFDRMAETMAAAGADLPVHLSKRMNAISQKIERRMKKLAKRGGKRIEDRGDDRGERLREKIEGNAAGPGSLPKDRGKRIFLSGMLAVGLSLALGLVTGISKGPEEVGVSAGMLAFFMSAGLLLSKGVTNWLASGAMPAWPQHIVRLVCLTPFLFLGAAPLLSHGSYEKTGFALVLGLLTCGVFARWEKQWDSDGQGELRIGCAIGVGIGAGIST